MIAILLVAYNEHEMTGQCLAALAGVTLPSRVWVLDNGSTPSLSAYIAPRDTPGGAFCPDIVRSDSNLGFAAGMNHLIARALVDPAVDAVLLLNNDTLPQSGFLEAMASNLDCGKRVDMVAAHLLNAEDPACVDSLGITLYRSGLASNRKQTDQRLLGPTGGCMLLSRRLLETLESRHGEWFDESFFCYAEDTDLVMRARWLGFECAYAHDAVVLHHGSVSSGGPDNEFILYHGIRNSIWALLKNAPWLWLFAHSPWIIAAHVGIWLRNLRKRRFRTLCGLYRDALVGLPEVLRKRRRVMRGRERPKSQWWAWVEPRFYEPDYVRRAMRELVRSQSD